MANQSGADTYVWVRDGAYIHKNSGYGIYANNGGHVIMEGGEISENTSYGIYVRSKDSYPRGTLDMTGGKIINNSSAGIYYETCSKNASSYVKVIGGDISGNGSSYSNYQMSITGANATDTISNIFLKKGFIKATEERPVAVNTAFGKLTFDEDYSDIYLGNAKSAASNKIGDLVKVYKTDDNDTNEYTQKGDALWFKPTTDSLHFTVPQPSKYTINHALPLYVVYIPLKADGTPADNAELTVVKVNNTATVDIDLKNLIPDQPYALMWMQQTEKFGTFTIKADPSVLNEVLGQSDYEADYSASYTLTKDIAGLIKTGDTFTAVIELDPQLSYYKDDENDSLKLDENDAFELASTTPKLTRSSDGSRWIMEVELKVKEGFTAAKNKNYPVNLIFKATIHITNADFKDDVLKTNGYIKGSVLLSGNATPTAFKLEAPVSADTELKALPAYTITYTGGSVTVKEGTILSSDLTGGTSGTALPETATENITIVDPTRGGYTFTGWRLVNGTTAAGIPSVTFIAQWTANETPAPTPTPTTPTTTTTTTPPAPAPLAMAPTVIPAAVPAAPTPAAPVEIAEPETPLAEPEAPAAEPEEEPQQIEEPEVPLASGVQGSWALLNLLLMLFTAVSGLVLTVSAARKEEENEKRKRALRISSLIPAVVSVVVFLLTENLRAPMRFVNARTMWMVLFAVAQIALIVLSRKSEEKAQVEE